jgi:hypothetical protein
MATREQLYRLVDADPFVPFIIGMVSGKRIKVDTAGAASCSDDGRELTVTDEHGARHLDMMQVESVEKFANSSR